MGISKKGKRSIIVNKKRYWWFVREDSGREPYVQIIADDHSFIASCNLYAPVLRIVKDQTSGPRIIAIPQVLSEEFDVFTPRYISEIIRYAASYLAP